MSIDYGDQSVGGALERVQIFSSLQVLQIVFWGIIKQREQLCAAFIGETCVCFDVAHLHSYYVWRFVTQLRESHLKCLVILGNCINYVYIQHKMRSVDTYIIISDTILRLTTVLISNHVMRHNQVCAGMSEQFYITRIGYGICHWYPECFCDRTMDYFITITRITHDSIGNDTEGSVLLYLIT